MTTSRRPPCRSGSRSRCPSGSIPRCCPRSSRVRSPEMPATRSGRTTNPTRPSPDCCDSTVARRRAMASASPKLSPSSGRPDRFGTGVADTRRMTGPLGSADVADRDEISALVYRYAELLDAGDFDGVVALFADATWRSDATGAVLRTPEEIRAVYDRIALYDGTPKTRHLMNNLVIDLVDGADEATGRCYYTVLQGIEPGAPLQVILAGRYVDRYRRGPDGWQFADRLFIVDLGGDQSRHFS